MDPFEQMIGSFLSGGGQQPQPSPQPTPQGGGFGQTIQNALGMIPEVLIGDIPRGRPDLFIQDILSGLSSNRGIVGPLLRAGATIAAFGNNPTSGLAMMQGFDALDKGRMQEIELAAAQGLSPQEFDEKFGRRLPGHVGQTPEGTIDFPVSPEVLQKTRMAQTLAQRADPNFVPDERQSEAAQRLGLPLGGQEATNVTNELAGQLPYDPRRDQRQFQVGKGGISFQQTARAPQNTLYTREEAEAMMRGAPPGFVALPLPTSVSGHDEELFAIKYVGDPRLRQRQRSLTRVDLAAMAEGGDPTAAKILERLDTKPEKKSNTLIGRMMQTLEELDPENELSAETLNQLDIYQQAVKTKADPLKKQTEDNLRVAAEQKGEKYEGPPTPEEAWKNVLLTIPEVSRKHAEQVQQQWAADQKAIKGAVRDKVKEFAKTPPEEKQDKLGNAVQNLPQSARDQGREVLPGPTAPEQNLVLAAPEIQQDAPEIASRLKERWAAGDKKTVIRVIDKLMQASKERGKHRAKALDAIMDAMGLTPEEQLELMTGLTPEKRK